MLRMTGQLVAKDLVRTCIGDELSIVKRERCKEMLSRVNSRIKLFKNEPAEFYRHPAATLAVFTSLAA